MTLGTNLVKNDLGGVGVNTGGGQVTETPLYTFTSHTFTNCGATGRTGPSLSSCQSAYAGQSWASSGALFTQ